MTASAFFSGLSEHFVMKACPRHCDRERSVAGSNPDSFFCFLPPLQAAAAFYLDCHVAALLAMTASAFFSNLPEHVAIKACPRHCDRERSVAGSNPDSFFCFLPPLQAAAKFYLDCHVAALLAMTASASFSSLPEHFVMKACPRT